MKYSQTLGQTLSNTLEELCILEELQLDEIRDPAKLKAEIKRLGSSTHKTSAARLERLQQLHDRKIASDEARQRRAASNEGRMHGIARQYGYKPVKGQHGHFTRDGHSLTIGPGNKWSHRKKGNQRSTLGRTPIRTLIRHLKSLHEDVSVLDGLMEGMFSVSNTGSGWAVTSGPRGGKRMVAGPFPSKYAANLRKSQMLSRIVGAQQQRQAPHPLQMGEAEALPKVKKPRLTPAQKKAKDAYNFASSEQDRYMGSVFAHAHGQRNHEAKVKAAHDWYKHVMGEEVIGPMHTTEELHETLTDAGWVHLIDLSSASDTYDLYEHRSHGRIMIDKDGNHGNPMSESASRRKIKSIKKTNLSKYQQSIGKGPTSRGIKGNKRFVKGNFKALYGTAKLKRRTPVSESVGPLASSHPMHDLAVKYGYGHRKSTHHDSTDDTVHEYYHPGHGHSLQLMSEPKKGGMYHHFTHQTFSKQEENPLYRNGDSAKELESRLKETHN